MKQQPHFDIRYA